jgi:hypothetical protein
MRRLQQHPLLLLARDRFMSVLQQIAAVPAVVIALLQLLSSDGSDISAAQAAAATFAGGSGHLPLSADGMLLRQHILAVPAAVAGLVKHLPRAILARVLHDLVAGMGVGPHEIQQAQTAAVPGVVTGLLHLLGSSSRHVQDVAAGALINLALKFPSVAQHIAEVPEAVSTFVRLLDSDVRRLQQAGAALLCGAASSSGVLRKQMAEDPGLLWALLQLLGSRSLDGQHAAWAVFLRFTDDFTAAIMRQHTAVVPGVLTNLVQLLVSSNRFLTVAAINVMWLLAGEEQGIQEAIAAAPGALAALLQLLGDRSAPAAAQQQQQQPPWQEVQHAAIMLLDMLAESNASVKQSIADAPGAITSLVHLLGSSESKLQESAAWMLQSLASGSAARTQLIAQGEGIEAALSQLLDSSDPAVCRQQQQR